MRTNPGSLRRVVCRAALAIGALAIFLAADCAAATMRLPVLHDLEIGWPGSTLGLSRDGRSLAVEMNGRLLVLAYPTGRVEYNLGDGLMPLWAASGDRVAFYSARSGSTQLWVWSSATGAKQMTHLPSGIDPDVPTRFMGPTTDALRYSWSPDGRYIVFASRVEKARDAASADEPLVLSNASPPELTTSGVCALPAFCDAGIEMRDGRNLIIAPMKPDSVLVSQLFLVDTRSGSVTQLTSGEREIYDPIWTADGTAVVAAAMTLESGSGAVRNSLFSGTGPSRGQIVRIGLRTGSTAVVLNTAGSARSLALSPDGRRMAYVVSNTYISPAHLEVADFASGRMEATRWSAPTDEVRWSKDNDTLTVFCRSDSGDHIADVQPERPVPSSNRSTNVDVIAWAEDASGGIVWIDGKGGVEYLRDGAKAPREMFSFRPTNLLLGREESIAWKNGRGEALHGSLLYPPDYVPGRRYPLIVDAYPFAHAQGWMESMAANQTWAAAGYVLFLPGERAPNAWMNATDLAFGAAGKGPKGFDVGIDDVMSGVNELDRRGIIDPNRMCLYGHSNGGGAVSYLVTLTKRFKCAVVVSPAEANWLVWPVMQTGKRKVAATLSGGFDFDRDIEDYVKMSSVFNLYKSSTPMLIACGDDDPALVDAIGIYNAVRDTGTEVTFVRYPGQGHVFAGSAMEDFWKREMAFFARYLKPETHDHS